MICRWCGKSEVPKKREDHFCSDTCLKDYEENDYPSWMTGKIGEANDIRYEEMGEYTCLSAPNRYRQLFRKKLPLVEVQKNIIELQRKDFPDIPNPLGIDFHYPDWDMVLIWKI